MVKLNSTYMKVTNILITYTVYQDEDDSYFKMKIGLKLSDVVSAEQFSLCDDYNDLTTITLTNGEQYDIDANIDAFLKIWKEYEKKTSFLFGVN